MPVGSEPLQNARREHFAQNVAAGLNLADSWEQAGVATGAKQAGIESNRVGGSRANKREDVQVRSAFLKRARVSESDEQVVTSTTLLAIMSDVSNTLRLAIQKCESYGETSISQRLRLTLLQHVSRHDRASRRVGEVIDDEPFIDTSAMLARLTVHGCRCE